MGKFKKNNAMVNNQGIDVVVNRTEEPLMKLKKRSKPLKVRHESKQGHCPTCLSSHRHLPFVPKQQTRGKHLTCFLVCCSTLCSLRV